MEGVPEVWVSWGCPSRWVVAEMEGEGKGGKGRESINQERKLQRQVATSYRGWEKGRGTDTKPMWASEGGGGMQVSGGLACVIVGYSRWWAL